MKCWEWLSISYNIETGVSFDDDIYKKTIERIKKIKKYKYHREGQSIKGAQRETREAKKRRPGGGPLCLLKSTKLNFIGPRGLIQEGEPPESHLKNESPDRQTPSPQGLVLFFSSLLAPCYYFCDFLSFPYIIIINF